MNFLQLHDLRFGDGAFAKRVTVAVAKSALDTMANPAATPEQKAWARTALRDTPAMAERFLWGVIGDPGVQAQGAGVSDAELLAAVESLVDAVGVGA